VLVQSECPIAGHKTKFHAFYSQIGSPQGRRKKENIQKKNYTPEAGHAQKDLQSAM
jgi:hypothetical protein